MMMNNLTHSLVRIGLSVWMVSLAVLAQGVSPVAAQTTSTAQFGVTVSPVTDEFNIKPGEVVTRVVKVSNPVNDLLTLYPVTLNFTTDNDKGQPKFYTLAEKSSRFAISDWISYDKPFIRLAAGQVDQFTYTVTAPGNAEPGGHYGAVLFSTTPPKVDPAATQVSVVGLIGSLVLATVAGALQQTTVIDQFDTPTFLVHGPAAFSLLFTNSGNVHTKPQGEIQVRNWSGTVVSALKINDGGGNILPGSSRRFGANWSFDWMRFGKYTATAAISYGNPATALSATRTFVVLPIWLIILLILILLGLIYLIIHIWRKRQLNSTTVPASSLPPAAPPAA